LPRRVLNLRQKRTDRRERGGLRVDRHSAARWIVEAPDGTRAIAFL
jgi:hypothetical protein